LLLYFSLIYPHLTYGITTWGSVSDHKLDLIYKLQKRAVPLIILSKYRAHAEPLFTRLNVLKLFDIYKLQSVLFVYKSLHQIYLSDSVEFYSRFKFHQIAVTYNTRSLSDNLCKCSARTQLRHTSLMMAGPRLWNSLNDSIKSLSSISTFKKEVKKYYISHYVN